MKNKDSRECTLVLFPGPTRLFEVKLLTYVKKVGIWKILSTSTWENSLKLVVTVKYLSIKEIIFLCFLMVKRTVDSKDKRSEIKLTKTPFTKCEPLQRSAAVFFFNFYCKSTRFGWSFNAPGNRIECSGHRGKRNSFIFFVWSSPFFVKTPPVFFISTIFNQ